MFSDNRFIQVENSLRAAEEIATMESVCTEPTNSDYLVCGTCTRNFPLENFVGFVQHKRFDCDDEVQTTLPGMRQTATLLCRSCPGRFGTPWSLLKHAQSVHALQIYLEQGAYSEGISSVGVQQEGWGQPRSQECAVSERCALPQDGSSTSVVTPPSAFKEDTPREVHSAMETQHEGDSRDGLKTDERHEGLVGDVGVNVVHTPDAMNTRKKKVCCDSQECGISLMPITHEEPKKCCCAVVPKWRKRHMETKHMRSARGGSAAADKSRSPSIFIDLVGSTDGGKNTPDLSTMVESHSEDSSSYSMTVVSNNSVPTTSTERSVIIQPGTSFSIPIRYVSPLTSVASSLPSQTTTTSLLSNVSPFTDYHSLLLNKQLSPSSSLVLASEVPSVSSRESEVESDSGNGASGNMHGSGKKRRYPTSRPFKCDQCDNAFNQRIHLKKHQSKHTGVKPFKCGQCDYSTVERSHLKVHIRVHTGEKPFHCTYCEYATAQNSTLKIHLKRHHADTAPFTCPSCGAHFSQKSLLDCHMRREHGIVSASSSISIGSPDLGQGHLQQSEGFTVQGQILGEARGQLESFTDHGQFERPNDDTPERMNAGKEFIPRFSGDSPHGS